MSFVNVLYGQNQKLLVNSNCCIGNLIHWIRARSQTAKNVGIDLADNDGLLQNLAKLKESAYALDVLKNRREYILVQIEKDENLRVTITPLLQNVEHAYPQLIEKLREQAVERSPPPATTESRNSSRPGSRKSSNGNAITTGVKTRISLNSLSRATVNMSRSTNSPTNSTAGSYKQRKKSTKKAR